jgi:predicted flap endonuclease-1-like 5' DNA nuclease
MNTVAMFVLGLLIGWLAEWAMDWYYWRGRIGRLSNENTNLKERITSLEAERIQSPVSAKGLPLTDRYGNDNLQAIQGIGPVFARRLKDAGIGTFEQLSKASSTELEETLGTLYKRFFSKQERIRKQAKEFAQRRKQKG